MTTFTNDWFNYQRQFIERFLPIPPPEQPYHILEIGVYEGAGTTFYLDHYMENPDSTITCIDPFDSLDTTCNVSEKTFELFVHNLTVSRHPQKCKLYKGTSRAVLPVLALEGREFDFISVDGSHVVEDVLFDAVLAWEILKPGGIILFDDYLQTYPHSKGPKDAVDSLKLCHPNDLEVLHSDYHVFMRKKPGPQRTRETKIPMIALGGM